MAKLMTSVIIFLGLLSIGQGLLFDDESIVSEETIYPFIYHRHDIQNLANLKQVISEHGVVYLVIPTEPPIELKLDNKRLPDQFPVTTYDHSMQPFTEQALTENCFYHGVASNHEGSFAVIDGCQAPNIKGYISIDGRVLLLEPAEEDDAEGGHIVRTYVSQTALSTYFSTKPISQKKITEELAEEDGLIRDQRQAPTPSPPLFIEVYVVCDNALFRQFNRDSAALQAKIRMIIEVLKEIYLEELGIHIFLSGIEIWTNGDLINPKNNDLRTMFPHFLQWKQDSLLPRQPHDFAMLISGIGYTRAGSNPPLVYRTLLCNEEYSGLAMKEVNLNDPVLPSMLARSLAFNVGLRQVNNVLCPCGDASGCIMDRHLSGWTQGPPTKFANCSRQELQTNLNRGKLDCLLNQPDGFVFPARCGDGNVDEGEECDCGPEEDCLDMCCDAVSCVYDYSRPRCWPTTQPPSTTEYVPPTTKSDSTTVPPVYVTTFVDEFVTEMEILPNDFTTSYDVEEEPISSTEEFSHPTTQPAATERPLTEDEIQIRMIKDILNAESTQLEVPPSLIKGPAGGELEYFTAGSNVTLPCEVNGLPQPSISWYKNKVEILAADPRLVFEDGSLIFLGALASDAGDYYCRANNTHGVVLSETVTLTLAHLDHLSFNVLEHYDIIERDSLVLYCQIPASNPPPEIVWTKDVDSKEPVSLVDGVSQTPAGNLVFSSARPEHTGDYACLISNPVTREVRIAHSISVKVEALAHAPAWVHTSPQHTTVQRGKPLSLYCIPSGSPVPSVKWEKLGEDGELDELKTYGHTLTIPSLDVGDSGRYRCTATNGVGESTVEVFNVTVEDAPRWITRPANVEIPAGSSHSFVCEASGIPLPDISWLVNGKPAEQEIEKYPHLSFSSEPGLGIFNITDGLHLNVVLQCIAENKHGKLLTNAYANIIVFPARIVSPPPSSVSVIEGHDVRIPCQGLGAPEPEIYWQVGVKTLEAEEDGSLFIPAVGTGDANTYYCRVQNKYDHQFSKVRLHVKGLTQVALSTNDVTVEEETELILTCQVDHHADSPPEIKWSGPDGPLVESNRTLIEVNHDMSMSSLLMEKVTLADSGYYTCTAVTDYDEATDRTHVGVTEKVVIQKPPKPGNISISRSHLGLLVMWESEYLLNAPVTSFLVEARNNYYPDHWENMREVSGDQESAVVKVNPYVTYWFRVTARNEVGESVSSRSRPVSLPSSTPEKNPKNVQVDVSDPRIVKVSWEEMGPLEHAGPKFFYRVRWRPLGTKKWKDVKIRDHTVTEYEFEMDHSEGPGVEVAVKSGNFIGSGPRAVFVSTSFVNPTTVAPLTFDLQPPIFSRVMEGRDFRINCTALGGSDLQTSWFKDGMWIESEEGNYTIHDDGSLLISNFGYEDVGVYECTIESSTGETINARTHLEIRRRTRVTVLPDVLEAVEYSTVEVYCDIELDTNVVSFENGWLDPENNTIQHQYDVIDERVYLNESTLIIEDVMPSDAGKYTCLASTAEDYAEATFTLTVKDLQPPLVSPTRLVVQIQNSTSLSASWGTVSDEDAGGPVLGYFAIARLFGEVNGEREECFTNTTRCLFLDLTPTQSYEVFVAVRTSAGQGPFSTAVVVTMPEPEPVRPGPVQIEKLRPFAKTLAVRWVAPAEGDPLYGYILTYAADGDQLPIEQTFSPSTDKHKLSGLVPGTSYTISLQAYNAAGRGPKVTQKVTTKSKNA